MLEQNIFIDKLIEVLQRVKARDGIETITTFELLHILPSEECSDTGHIGPFLRTPEEDIKCANCGIVFHRNEGGVVEINAKLLGGRLP